MKKMTRILLFALAVLGVAPSWAYDKDKLYQIVSVKFPAFAACSPWDIPFF